MTVNLYADVVLLISLLVNMPVFWSTARLYGLKFSVSRSALACVFCGISAIFTIMYKLEPVKAFALYVFVFTVSVYIAFGKNKLKAVLKIAFMLLWHSVILGGICNVINLTLHSDLRQYISLACVFAGTVIFCIAIRMRKSAYAVSVDSLKISRCKLRIYLGADEYILEAMVDSGNMLTEPLSQCPVIVAGKHNDKLCENIKSCKNKRFVPIATLTGSGIIECAPARAWLCGKHTEELGDVYIGVSENLDYEAVVGTAVFNMRSGVRINE